MLKPATSSNCLYSSLLSLGRVSYCILTQFIKKIQFSLINSAFQMSDDIFIYRNLNAFMETLTLISFYLKFLKDFDKPNQSWVYCVFKWGDQAYCTRAYEITNKDWTQQILHGGPVEMEMPKNHHLFKLELWNYDTEQKIGQTSITSSDLTCSERQKQFSINDRKIHLKFYYERKTRAEQNKEIEIATLRVNYNKSDPNLLKGTSKPSSACIKRTVNQLDEYQLTPARYDSSCFGKWKFIPTRHENQNQKLRL